MKQRSALMNLEELQSWFLGAITEHRAAEGIVKPNRRMSADERMAIYLRATNRAPLGNESGKACGAETNRSGCAASQP